MFRTAEQEQSRLPLLHIRLVHYYIVMENGMNCIAESCPISDCRTVVLDGSNVDCATAVCEITWSDGWWTCFCQVTTKVYTTTTGNKRYAVRSYRALGSNCTSDLVHEKCLTSRVLELPNMNLPLFDDSTVVVIAEEAAHYRQESVPSFGDVQVGVI
jgi:hypothetical protein